MNDENSLNNGTDNNAPKKSNTLIIGIIWLIVIIGGWLGYYFMMNQSTTDKVPWNVINKDTKANTAADLAGEKGKVDETTIDTTLIEDETKEKTDNAIDASEVLDETTINTETTDTDKKTDNTLSNIEWETLDAEEKKLTWLLDELKNEDNTKKEEVVVDTTSIVEKYKIPVLANGKLDIPADYINVNNDKNELTEKGLTDLWIEKNSVVYDLVNDNINTWKNNYANSSFKFKTYELTIDKDYKIINVKKDSVVEPTSQLLGITIFEIQNFYKPKN